MTALNIRCAQRDYLVRVLQSIQCDATTQAPQINVEEELPGFRSNEVPGTNYDPENEVIFDPENEVIFDPESEVIFDPQQVFNPTDGKGSLQRFQSLYDCYGNKINLSQFREELIKLLIWLFKYEQYQSLIESYCSETTAP